MATITYTVTVASGTNAFSAGVNKFYINGDVSPVLYLQEGNTHIFLIRLIQPMYWLLLYLFLQLLLMVLLQQVEQNIQRALLETGTPGTAGAKTTIVVAPVRTVGAPLIILL